MEIYLKGWGSAFPPHEYTNAELGGIFNLPSERWQKYEDILGTKRRRMVVDHGHGGIQTTSGEKIATESARQAIVRSGTNLQDIDVLICTSGVYDYMLPAQATRIQKHLGLSKTRCINLTGGCAEFLNALTLAQDLLLAGRANNILVVASEVTNSLWRVFRYPLDFFLFGDAAAAFVLSTQQGPYKLRQSTFHTVTHLEDQLAELYVYPIVDHKTVPPFDVFLSSMNNYDKLFDQYAQINPHFRLFQNIDIDEGIARHVGQGVNQFLETHHINRDSLFLVGHQVGLRYQQVLSKSVNIPMDRIALSVLERGNMVSASVPVAFCDYELRFGRTELILLMSFGVGVSFGCLLLERVPVRTERK